MANRTESEPFAYGEEALLFELGEIIRYWKCRGNIQNISDGEVLGVTWELYCEGRRRGINGYPLRQFVAWRLTDELRKKEGLTGGLRGTQELTEGVMGAGGGADVSTTYLEWLWTFCEDVNQSIHLPGLQELLQGKLRMMAVDLPRTHMDQQSQEILEDIGGGSVPLGVDRVRKTIRILRRLRRAH